MSDADHEDAGLVDERVALVGRFGGYSRRELADLIARNGGAVVAAEPTLTVIGAETSHAADQAARSAAEPGARIESEADFVARFACPESEASIRDLYTPAMLAEAVGVPVGAVRRWTRRGYLRPVRRLNRLAYYDFGEATVARRLAEALRSAGGLVEVDRIVDRLSRAFPELDRPIETAPIVFDGGRVLLRDGEALAEPGGQRVIDFATAAAGDDRAGDEAAVLSIAEGEPPPDPRRRAEELHDSGDPDGAIRTLRLAMLGGVATADDHFVLGEWLYEVGEPQAARERFYAALELDEDDVDARVSLGCVLDELGETELARAAFRGALDRRPEYADAHFHLAGLLTRSGDAAGAADHLRTFLEIAPESPWADEARRRLSAALSE